MSIFGRLGPLERSYDESIFGRLGTTSAVMITVVGY